MLYVFGAIADECRLGRSMRLNKCDRCTSRHNRGSRCRPMSKRSPDSTTSVNHSPNFALIIMLT
ncbi:MAG: hypothetical protein DSM106950_16745 [Stigonema ocellatum SAG 48.90 = DSM 106950]|nr:hypothetical protein [Stigonema ocellatum SAG 48.90 = DSM 106950]